MRRTRKPLNQKGRFKANENPLKIYHRKHTVEQVHAHAERCRAEHLADQTPAEIATGQILLGMGIDFIAEHIIYYASGYKFIMADIYLPEYGIIIELDGSGHKLRERNDRERDIWLATQGLFCIRFENYIPLKHPETVSQKLLELMRR